MINTRKIAEEYRLTHWTGIIRERSNSGMNIKEFCKHIGICQNTYFYWQRRVRAAASQELTVRTRKEIEQTTNDNIVPNGWAVCEVAKPETSAKQIIVEVGKFRIITVADADNEHLARVCRTLLSLC